MPQGRSFVNYPSQRRRRLTLLIKKEGLDALLVSNPINVTYLTGFSGDSSYLVLGRKRTLLFSDARFTEQIAEECLGLETYIRPPGQRLHEAVIEVLDKLRHRGIRVE